MTVAELEQRLSVRELMEWIAYDTIEPFGSPVEDQRFGMLAAISYNLHRGPKSPAMTPSEFFDRDPSSISESKKQAKLSDQLKAAFSKLKRKPASD